MYEGYFTMDKSYRIFIRVIDPDPIFCFKPSYYKCKHAATAVVPAPLLHISNNVPRIIDPDE